jgi:hypothetical protein
VVPVRFERVDSGFSEFDQPDPDNRGFAMGTRPASGWNSTDARGTQVGIMQSKEVEIRLIREDIDRGAHLYVVSTQPSICEVLQPRTGRRLPGNGIIRLRGVTSRDTRPVKIQVRLGSADDGPVIAELEPQIFALRRLRIRPHRVRIDCQTGTTVTNGRVPSHIDINRAVTRARKIWRPLGIEFGLQPMVDNTLRLTAANQVIDPDDDSWAEVRQVLGIQRAQRQADLGSRFPTNWKDQCINWYIVHEFRPSTGSAGTTLGLGIRRDLADRLTGSLGHPVDPGVITVDNGVTSDREQERVGRTLAHEIGHFLGLEHCHNRHANNPALDTYSRRALMYPLSWLDPAHTDPNLANQPRFDDAGYGNRVRGCLLTIKDHPQHNTDGECRTCHDTIQNRRWY